MAGLFVVTGKKGAVCRAGCELDSERLVDVPKGETVYVVEASSSACGVARLHVAFPVDGWVSAKVVGRWSSQAKRTKHGRDGGGLGFAVGEPAALSKSRWDAQERCAGAGGFGGVFLTASEYHFVAPARDAWAEAYVGADGARAALARWCVGLAPRVQPSDRDGYVALPAHLDEPGGFTRVACPLGQLGECADSSCSCYRPARPRCRAQFRDLARDLCCERLGSAPGALDRGGVLRYASIGAGLLLSDAEVLGALIRDGFELRSACVVDTCYARNKLAPRTEAALREFANFVGAPVHVFSSMGALREAALLWPGAFGRCTFFANIDAAVPDKDLVRCRDAVLSPGGVAAQLNNHGSSGRSSANAWVRETSDDNFNGRGRAWRADDGDDAPWRVAGAVPGAFRPRPRPKSDDLGFPVYGGGGGPLAPDASEVLAYGAPGDNPCHVRDLALGDGDPRLPTAEATHARLRRDAAKAGAARLFAVVASCAHVRDGPRLDAKVVGTLRRGHEVLAVADAGADVAAAKAGAFAARDPRWVPLDAAANARFLLDKLIPTHASYDASAVADALASRGAPRLWMLTHGAPLGMGPLLEELDASADAPDPGRPRPPPAQRQLELI